MCFNDNQVIFNDRPDLVYIHKPKMIMYFICILIDIFDWFQVSNHEPTEDRQYVQKIEYLETWNDSLVGAEQHPFSILSDYKRS